MYTSICLMNDEAQLCNLLTPIFVYISAVHQKEWSHYELETALEMFEVDTVAKAELL